MNDNHWYPRDPSRYLTDTQWCDHATEVAHVRLIDTFYALGKPITDNAEEISNIGKIKPQDYARVRGNLERLGWRFEGGFLRHRRIEETIAEMEKTRAESIKRTEAARAARASGKGQTKPVTNSVTKIVTDNVTTFVSEFVTKTQLQLQQHLSSDTDTRAQAVELPHGFPHTADEAKVAAMFVGCPEAFAEATWNKAMSRNGRDAKDIPIRSWRHYLATEFRYEQSRNAEKQAKKQPESKQLREKIEVPSL